MSDLKELLEMRNKMNKKRPAFFRKEHYRKKKIGSGWRKARGLDNKQRLQKRGAPLRPSIGHRGPKQARGLHKTGIIPVLVKTVAQLKSVTKDQGVIISGKVGDKKRHAILIEMKKKGIVLLNLDIDKAIENIQLRIKQRADARKEELTEAKKKKEEKEDKEKKKNIDEQLKKAEPKKDGLKQEQTKEPDEGVSEEERKKQEKEEKDKLLIKRE